MLKVILLQKGDSDSSVTAHLRAFYSLSQSSAHQEPRSSCGLECHLGEEPHTGRPQPGIHNQPLSVRFKKNVCVHQTRFLKGSSFS